MLADDTILSHENLLPEREPETHTEPMTDGFKGYSLKASKKIVEKKLITKALIATGGNRTKAAELLEISHPSLLSKMKAYNINL